MEGRSEQQYVGRELSCRRAGSGRPAGGWRKPEQDPFACSHYRALMTVRRDLHDQVGAALAGMAMQLELARRLVRMDASTAHVVLSELRSDVTELIAQVRRIGNGRETGRQLKDVEGALRSLVRQVNRAVGPRLVVSLHFDPRARSVPEQVGSAAFWIVREAVVNVLKHSTARQCAVSVSVAGAMLHVRVDDDGQVTAPAPAAGSGLVNMSARAADLGGRCAAGPQDPNGFAVVASLPLPGGGRSAGAGQRSQRPVAGHHGK